MAELAVLDVVVRHALSDSPVSARCTGSVRLVITPGPTTVAVLADTHRTADRARDLPSEVYSLLEQADVVLHAGDIVDQAVLEVLADYAPVHAVLGNNDKSLLGALPERLVVELAGVVVGMVHDSGPAQGRAGRLKAWFPDADVVVFGHSHIPWNQPGVDGQLLLNPGSPTQRRRQPVATAGRLVVHGGVVQQAEIIPVGHHG